jgi:Site-specific DNA methylase
MRPTFIDMFSGAGLFSAGMVAAGFEPALAIDLAPDAVESYRRNVAGTGIVGSVTDDRHIPQAMALIAGPPCQGFSTLGRRDPADARNSLSLSILPWVDRSGASIVVVENVPPFLKSTHWAALRDGFVARGFSVDTWELDAYDYGAPQRRVRAFTIASRIGPVERPAPTQASEPAAIVISRPIADGDAMHFWPKPSKLAFERISRIPAGGDKRDLMRSNPELCPESWFEIGCHATDVWGRMRLDGPSNTLRCTFQNPSKGRYVHPVENRVLSLREGARLQGIPDEWTFAGKPASIMRQIGNGVPVHLAAAVGRAVHDAIMRQAYSAAA